MPIHRIHGQLRNLNWKPALKDFRDKRYTPKPKLAPLPDHVDPLDAEIAIWDQGQLGSCTAHGTGSLWAHRMLKEGKGQVMPSRLFIYYCERVIEDTVSDDNGALVRDGLKALADSGVPPESYWPYDIARFDEKPPQEAYDAALNDVALEYNAVDMNLDAIKHCLADGNPITFGFTVFESINNTGPDGMMPMPSDDERILGGHCVAFVGYDDAKQCFICRNSWGVNSGFKGRFYMPYSNLPNCSDGWVLTSVK